MAVNTAEVTSVYDTLLASMVAKYDTMWTANEIDAETYAQLVGQASSQLVQLAADLVQKQEALDKDVLLKQAQIDIANKELLIKDQELALRETEVIASKATAEAQLEKQWGYEVTRTIDGKDNLILGAATSTGKVDYENANLLKQGILLETEEQIKQFQVDNILPLEVLSMTKDNSIKDEQLLEIQEKVDLLQTQDLTAIYEKDFLLPEQLTKLQEEVDLLQTQDLNALEQLKIAYTDRVLKDKQAAKLGLDNVMKAEEAARVGNDAYVYTPNYEAP